MKKIKYFLIAIITVSMISGYSDSRTKEQKKIDKSLTKKLIGQWVNPYTYESTGELKGYDFKKKGKCSAINIPSWELKTWKIEKGWVTITGFDIDEKGNKTPYESKEKISKLTKDTLQIIVLEKPRTTFLYVNPNTLKK